MRKYILLPFILLTLTSCSKEPLINKTLKKIEIKDMTTSFYQGDDFIFDGTLIATFEINDIEEIEVVEPTSYTTPNMEMLGEQEVNVNYVFEDTTKTTSYTIDIKEKPIDKQIELVNISLKDMKKSFYKDESFVFDGIVIAYYSDDSFKEVKPTKIDEPDMSTSGSKKVTIYFKENNIEVKESYYINVIEETGIPSSGQTLPIGKGNTTVDGPLNYNNPVDISNWINYDFYDSLPTYWSYIRGNNKVKNASFYQDGIGGIKFSSLYEGLQSPLLDSYKKIEVRLLISQVNNNNKKDNDAPIFHIYGYNSLGTYIYQDFINQGTINTKSVGSEIKFYIKNIDVSYFELRLNAFPYKGSQCYNFGINKISIKGWDYE